MNKLSLIGFTLVMAFVTVWIATDSRVSETRIDSEVEQRLVDNTESSQIVETESPTQLDLDPVEENAARSEEEAESLRQAWLEIRPRLLSESPAEFPWQASAKGISEGYVYLEFVVTEDGTVADIVVRESTAAVFEGAAIAAVERYIFQPNLRDGAPVQTAGVTERIDFDVTNPNAQLPPRSHDRENALPMPVVKIAPRFPENALNAGLESGYVLVSFTLNPNGKPTDIAVVDSSSPLLEQSAVDAASRSAYRPQRVNGEPVATEGMRYRVDFNAPQAKSAQSVRSNAASLEAAG